VHQSNPLAKILNMKKTGFLVMLAFISFSSYAQLSATKWKTTLQFENSTDVYFDFGKDSLKVYKVADSSLLETSLYTEKGAELSILKVSGISECDGISGIYKFDIKNSQMVLTLVSDKCSDRSEVLDKAILTKITKI
jgi:hypothetical protein